MKRVIIFLSILAIPLFPFTKSILAQDNQTPLVLPTKDEILRAKVIKIAEEGEKEIVDKKYPYQIVEVEFNEGSEKGNVKKIDHGQTFTITEAQKVKGGETIVIVKSESPTGKEPIYQIVDTYRLNKIPGMLVVFAILVIFLSRWKGAGSILGLGISLLVIVKFIVPQILAGKDPLTISIAGSFIILASTIYLAHGFSKKTSVALFSTFLSLIITGILAVLFVNTAHLTGLGTEDANSLRFGPTSIINFQGLLLGAIIIGTLGVLDDVTTSLSAAIFEIKSANSAIKFQELLSKGLRVGSEHISSLVNTLVLAYAGASLPIFLFIILNPSHQPLWFILNSEVIMEEVVRTLAGSIGLVMAVPITAITASWVCSYVAGGNKK